MELSPKPGQEFQSCRFQSSELPFSISFHKESTDGDLFKIFIFQTTHHRTFKELHPYIITVINLKIKYYRTF